MISYELTLSFVESPFDADIGSIPDTPSVLYNDELRELSSRRAEMAHISSSSFMFIERGTRWMGWKAALVFVLLKGSFISTYKPYSGMI